MLGQRSRRLCGNFLWDQEVVAPNQDADMVCGHVEKIEKITLVDQASVGHDSPCAKVLAGYDAKAKCNSERSIVPGQPEMRGEQKQEQYQPTLDDVQGLFQDVGAG